MQSRGFEVLRGAVPLGVCSVLHSEVLAGAAATQTPLARALFVVQRELRTLQGMFGKQARPTSVIRSPRYRVHQELQMTDQTRAVLSSAVKALWASGAYGRGGLTESARLVELSSMVVFPGATAQDAHTDVPPMTAHRMHTVWVALQNVSTAMAPTVIYSNPPNEIALKYDWTALKKLQDITNSSRSYSSDGEWDIPRFVEGREEGVQPFPNMAALTAERNVISMDVGDVCLMDCRSLHFGSANVSQTPRALFSATFENEPVEAAGGGQGKAGGPNGFTYHLRDELQGKYSLADFME